MFTPSKLLLKNMNKQPHDRYDIIGALEGYINADKEFKENDFNEAINYVLNHGVSRDELFQEFNPNLDFEEDESKWNYDYYALARIYLKENFCEKRIAHVEAIAKKLYSKKAILPVQQKSVQSPQKSMSKSVQTKVVEQGGQQATGKKMKGQPKRRKLEITQIPYNVKIVGIVLISVVLVLLIVFIIKQLKEK